MWCASRKPSDRRPCRRLTRTSSIQVSDVSWVSGLFRRPPVDVWDVVDIIVVSVLIYEVLKLIRDNKWNIDAVIEFEYPIPAGSDRMTELKKSVEFCKAALA